MTKIEIPDDVLHEKVTDHFPDATPDTAVDLMKRVSAMDNADRTVVMAMLENIVQCVEIGDGTGILISDPTGKGSAMVIAIGNALLVAPLLSTAGAVGAKLFEQSAGPIQ